MEDPRLAGPDPLHLDLNHADVRQGHFLASAVAIRNELKQALFMLGHGRSGVRAIGSLGQAPI